MKTLLLGAGNSRRKVIHANGNNGWGELVTIDIDPNCNPDFLHDLNITPWPISDNCFDEIHAYEVLEHLGRQGDYQAFFAHFYECWRALKDDGLLCITVPSAPEWIWGDPGHTRLITKESLIFLDLDQYAQVGTSAMTDYRWCWHGNFKVEWQSTSDSSNYFVLRKVSNVKETQE